MSLPAPLSSPTAGVSPAIAPVAQPGCVPNPAGKAVPAYQLAALLLGAALLEQGFSTEQTAAWVGAAGRVLEKQESINA